jgi:mRNA interferase MazF
VNHGEVWTIVDSETAGRWRVAVVSGDGWNERPGAWPYVVPLTRRPAGELPPYVAELTDPDPVGGIALVAELGRVDPSIGVELVGMLTGASMANLGGTLRDLFELP